MRAMKRIVSLFVVVMVLFNIVGSEFTKEFVGFDTQAAAVSAPHGGDSAVAKQGTTYEGEAVRTARSTTDAALSFDFTRSESDFFSLGFSDGDDGWIIIEFDEAITNGPGDDLQVIEDTWTYGFYPEESADIYVSADGDDWEKIGDVDNDRVTDGYHAFATFDLDDLEDVDPESVRFVKVQDTSRRSDFDVFYANNYGSVPDGFDLNAVLALYEYEVEEYDVYFDVYPADGSSDYMGTVSKEMGTYDLGDVTDVAVTANDHYEFVQWWGEFYVEGEYVYAPLSVDDLDEGQLVVDGLMSDVDGLYMHTMSTNDQDDEVELTRILAEFQAVMYTITVEVATDSGGSSGWVNASGEATYGNSVSITVPAGTTLEFGHSAVSGYSYDRWDPAFEELPSQAWESATYKVYFDEDDDPTPKRYDLNIEIEGEGTVDGNSNDYAVSNLRKGTETIGQAVAADGWYLDIVYTEDDADEDDLTAPSDEDGDYEIYMDNDTTVVFVFRERTPEAVPYQLTVDIIGEGNVSPYTDDGLAEWPEKTDYDAGELAEFGDIEGINGYVFDSIIGENGDEVYDRGDGTYDILMTSDKSIVIKFVKEEDEDPELDIDPSVFDIADEQLPRTGGLPMAVPYLGGIVSMAAGFILRRKK